MLLPCLLATWGEARGNFLSGGCREEEASQTGSFELETVDFGASLLLFLLVELGLWTTSVPVNYI